MKRIVSFLLCFFLCFSLMPVMSSTMNNNDFRIEYSGPPEGGTPAVIKYQINDGDWISYDDFGDRQFYDHGLEVSVSIINFKVIPPKDSSNISIAPGGPHAIICEVEGLSAEEIPDQKITYDEATGEYAFSVIPTLTNEENDYLGFRIIINWTEGGNPPGGSGDPPGESDYIITLSVEGEGCFMYDGRAEVNREIPVVEGESPCFQIVPYQGYVVDDVLVNGETVGAVTSYTFENVTENQTIHATFRVQTFTITTVIKDDNGTVGDFGTISSEDPLTDIPYDNSRILTITPAEGYRIREIMDNGDPRGTNSTYPLNNIRENHTIEVIFEPVGTGSLRTITVTSTGNGTVSADGLSEGQVEVEDGNGITFTLESYPGYKVSVLVTQGEVEEDWSWNLSYQGAGKYEFPLNEVRQDMTIAFAFSELTEEDLTWLMGNRFVVLESEANDNLVLKASLVNLIGSYGFVITDEDIDISTVDKSDIDDSGYGIFTFTVDFDGTESEALTGYIVQNHDDIIFRLLDGENEVIHVVNLAPGTDELPVPEMHSGTMEVFGYGDLFAAPLDDVARDENGRIRLPFYRAQFHIMSFSTGINRQGVYAIQNDALCVKVEANSAAGEQFTPEWSFNRYVDLSEGNDTSYVFFGNDEFILSLPSSGIGGAVQLDIEEEDFGGYAIIDNKNGTYSVIFRSDFYDDITIDLTLNGTIERQLRIKRVGVSIRKHEYEGERYAHVFHGTQVSTLIDYNDGKRYRIYATYYIPARETTAPYGLYVTYTWADGSKTTSIITAPCDDPSPIKNAEGYEDGVFIYGNDPENPEFACSDYLIYSAANGANAPVKINITVLKGDALATESFIGIFFGSGAGVEWLREEED